MLLRRVKLIYLIELSDKRNIILFNKLKEENAAEGFSFADKKKQEFEGAVVVFSPARKLDKEEAAKLPKDSKVLGGKQSEEVKTVLKQRGISYYNILENENYAVKNAKLTAEGVLSMVICNTDRSVYDIHILILGCGRVGKATALLFGRLGLKTAVASFDIDEYNAHSLYAEKAYYKDGFVQEIGKYDIIINTVPHEILKDNALRKIKPKALVLELASVSCLDKEMVNKYPFKYVVAGSLPVIYSAESAAEIMLECVVHSTQIS